MNSASMLLAVLAFCRLFGAPFVIARMVGLNQEPPSIAAARRIYCSLDLSTKNELLRPILSPKSRAVFIKAVAEGSLPPIDLAVANWALSLKRGSNSVKEIDSLVKFAVLAGVGPDEMHDGLSTLAQALRISFKIGSSRAALMYLMTLDLDGAPGGDLGAVRAELFNSNPAEIANSYFKMSRPLRYRFADDIALNETPRLLRVKLKSSSRKVHMLAAEAQKIAIKEGYWSD